MKRRLIAVLCALVVVVALLGGSWLFAKNVRQANLESAPVMLYPTQSQLSDFNTMLASYKERIAQGDNPILTFGSSELRSNVAGKYSPAQFFLNNADFSLQIMGRIHCMSLWDAIEVGAFANELQDKRVVIFVSMQWFYTSAAKDHASEFQAIYSDDAFQAMMANSSISDETKAALQERMQEYGVSRDFDQMDPFEAATTVIDSALGVKVGNTRAAISLLGGESVKTGAENSRVALGEGAGSGESVSEDEWAAIIADAQAQAEENSEDEQGWYNASRHAEVEAHTISIWPEGDGKRAWADGEMKDFELLLDVCNEASIEPLIVIQPVKGEMYDKTRYTEQTREELYSSIREACDEHGVQYADMTTYSYDTYFLRDQSHPSSLGNAYYCKAIYDFMNQ